MHFKLNLQQYACVFCICVRYNEHQQMNKRGKIRNTQNCVARFADPVSCGLTNVVN